MAKIQDLASMLGVMKEITKESKATGQSWADIGNQIKAAMGAAGGGTGNMGGSGTVATPNFGGYKSGSGGFGGGLLNFGLSLPGIVANALPSPAAAASYQLATARQGFFSGGGFGSAAGLQRQLSGVGTAISSTDAVQAITNLQNAGIYNTGSMGRGLGILSNYEPGLGIAGTASAAASLNQARSVNMMNQIGIQVRGANGLFRDPNQIANDFVDKIVASTPPLRSNGADAYAYLIGSLQPGNQLYLILQTYIQDPNMRQIIIDKLFAKAKGLPGSPSKDQLTQAGLYTKTTGAQSAYNTSQLGLLQSAQAAENRGTVAALHDLTVATDKLAAVIKGNPSIAYGAGFAGTLMNGMNGSMGALISSLIGSLLGPALGGLFGRGGKGAAGEEAASGLSKFASGIGKFMKGLGIVGTALSAGGEGLSAGSQKKGFSWGTMFKDAAMGFVLSGFDPLGAVAGAGAYAGGYALGNMGGGSGQGKGLSAGTTLTAGSPQAASVLATAANQIGIPYSWGGGGTNGPSTGTNQGSNTVGFDCSSLVQYVFARQGINLPRTTYDQVKAGVAVDPLQAQAGDLLFFGDPKAPHHVGIYAGNGRMIQAPHTGGSVEVTGVDLRGVSACRRVLGAGAGNAVDWGSVLGNQSGLVSSGMTSSVNGYGSAGGVMAGGLVASGTMVATTGLNTQLNTGGGAASSSAGNITIHVNVPPTTDPKHVATTTRAITDGINAANNRKATTTK